MEEAGVQEVRGSARTETVLRSVHAWRRSEPLARRAACKARTENEVSAKTHLYSKDVAAKPHTRPGDAR